MISREEILGKYSLDDLSSLEQDNLERLLTAVNKLRAAYGKPMKVTSGFRSKADQIRIYADKGITDLAKIPMKSAHLSAEAVDFADPDNRLKDFINKCTPKQLEEFGIFYEDFKCSPGWLHCQIRKPASGKRFFIP